MDCLFKAERLRSQPDIVYTMRRRMESQNRWKWFVLFRPPQVTLIDRGYAKHKSKVIFFMDFLEIILSLPTTNEEGQHIPIGLHRALRRAQLQFPHIIKFAK